MRILGKFLYLPMTAAGVLTAALAGNVLANEELMELSADPKNWAMPTGDYANHRYSELGQITKDNVKDLQVKWTFSTGVLRGHEGGPLVIGDVMYVHMPSISRTTARSSGNTSHSRIRTSLASCAVTRSIVASPMAMAR
jgi:lanthanide-dependent methanol dehydrogenase